MGLMDSGGGAGEDYLPFEQQVALAEDEVEGELVSGFWLHQITYSRRPGHRRKHRWDCTCGEGSSERTSAKAQRRVAVHLFFSKKDYPHCWGEDARLALAARVVEHDPRCVSQSGNPWDESYCDCPLLGLVDEGIVR